MTATTVAPGITSDPGIQGGEPCIEGTRIPAMSVWRVWKDGGGFVGVEREYPMLNVDQIIAAVEYGRAQDARPKPASDGGPAFPVGCEWADANGYMRSTPDRSPGMSLRAYIATAMMAGMAAAGGTSAAGRYHLDANEAVMMADALLAALEAGHD